MTDDLIVMKNACKHEMLSEEGIKKFGSLLNSM